MAHHKSAKKRIRQDAKRRVANRYYKKSTRTAIKKLREMEDKKEAEKWLKKVLQKLPGTRHAEQASKMLDQLYDDVHATRDDHLEESAPELLAKDLKRGKSYYDRMLSHNKKGIVSMANAGPNTNGSQCKSSYESHADCRLPAHSLLISICLLVFLCTEETGKLV